MSLLSIAALVAALSGAGGFAQSDGRTCPADAPFLSADRETVPRMDAAPAVEALSAAMLPLDHRVDLSLRRAGDIRYAVAPEREAVESRQGGMAAFTVASAGRYRVELGTAAWIDVASGTALIPSVAHGHGPACSGIRKMVDFNLERGRHVLQISGSEASTIRIRVTRLP